VEQLQDVTDYKRTLNALQASEEKFRSIINAAKNVAMVVTDLESVVEEFSPGAEAVFGYRREEIVGKHVAPLHHYSRLEEFPEHIERLKRQRDGFTMETELIRKSGESFPALFTLQPLFDNQGNLIGTLGVTVDISDLKETEEKLRLSESKFRGLVENANDIVFTTSQEGTFHFVSSNWENILGHSPDEEVIGKSVLDFVHPEDHPKLYFKTRELISQGSLEAEIEYRVKHKNGTWRWHASRLSLMERKASDPFILGIARDITERKHVEEALVKSEERFQKMLSVIPDMVSIHDQEMNIVYSNWKGLAGVPPEYQVLNTKCYRTYRGYDDICPDCRAKKVLETGESYKAELELPEGNWVDLRIIPMMDKDNQVELFVEWVRDITERKQMELALQKSRDELQRREEYLNTLLSNMPAVVYSYKKSYIIPGRHFNCR